MTDREAVPMMHHLRRTDREITEPERVEALLREGRFCSIALADGAGPYLVTLSYGYDASGRHLYFHSASEGRKIDAIASDPRASASIVFDRGYRTGECAHPYESVVLRGRMRVVTDATEKRRGMQVLVEHQESPGEFSAMGFDNPAKIDSVTVLAFDIESVCAKEGQ